MISIDELIKLILQASLGHLWSAQQRKFSSTRWVIMMTSWHDGGDDGVDLGDDYGKHSDDCDDNCVANPVWHEDWSWQRLLCRPSSRSSSTQPSSLGCPSSRARAPQPAWRTSKTSMYDQVWSLCCFSATLHIKINTVITFIWAKIVYWSWIRVGKKVKPDFLQQKNSLLVCDVCAHENVFIARPIFSVR